MRCLKLSRSILPLRFFDFLGVTPVSRTFGFDRGQPIDRYYIEKFLALNQQDISGRVLEIGDPEYTLKFGGNRVGCSDVFHATLGNSKATIVGDLATGEGITDCVYDCIILTQTLPFIYDFQQAVFHAHAKLKNGGVLLSTLPGISQISRYDMDRWGDYWRFTNASASRLFNSVFGDRNVSVETYGNVFAACSFLQGLASQELSHKELDYHDPDYQVIITVRAVKRELP